MSRVRLLGIAFAALALSAAAPTPTESSTPTPDARPALADAPEASMPERSVYRRSKGAIGPTVKVIDQPGDVTVFGGDVDVSGAVGGSVWVAGGAVAAPGRIVGDLRILGGDVEQTGAVGGELSAAGGAVSISGRVGRALQAAGGELEILRTADIGGDVRMAGGQLEIAGRIGGDLDAAGESIVLDGVVEGDARLRARRIAIGPNARVLGRLEWEARYPPTLDPAAQVASGAEGQATEALDYQEWRQWGPTPDHPLANWVAAAVWSLAWAMSALLIGVLIAAAAPNLYERAAFAARGRWVSALAWGLLMLAAPILIAITLILTLVGLPLGVLTLMAYPFFLAAGHALGAAALGSLLVHGQGFGARLGALSVGILAIALAGLAPILGGVVSFAALLIGLGLFAFRDHHHPERAAGPTALEPATPPPT